MSEIKIQKITPTMILKHFFVKLYAENIPTHKAVHTVYSGLNAVLRKTGVDNPIAIQESWAKEGLVTTRLVKGGAQLFLTDKGHTALGIRPPSYVAQAVGKNTKVDGILADIAKGIKAD